MLGIREKDIYGTLSLDSINEMLLKKAEELPEKNENVQKSARNIEGVKTTLVNTINVYDLLKYNNLVVTLDTVKKLEEVYA